MRDPVVGDVWVYDPAVPGDPLVLEITQVTEWQVFYKLDGQQEERRTGRSEWNRMACQLHKNGANRLRLRRGSSGRPLFE